MEKCHEGSQRSGDLQRLLAYRFRSIAAASVEIPYLEGILQLPKGTVHIVSDLHGESRKLQPILNNASGSLRPFVEEVLVQRLTGEEKERVEVFIKDNRVDG
ncbi:MAG: fructose-bisphosphatase class III [Thermodesulfobacteriota bacterium]